MNQHSDTPQPSTSAPPAVLPPESPREATAQASTPEHWQAKYESQKKRSVLLATTTAGAAALAVAALVWGFAQSPGTVATSATAGTPGATSDQLPGGGPGGIPAGPGAGAMNPASELFSSDGTVDTAAVEQFVASLPPGIEATTMIDRMLSDGAITSNQAEALLTAISALSDGVGDA